MTMRWPFRIMPRWLRRTCVVVLAPCEFILQVALALGEAVKLTVESVRDGWREA